MNRFKRLTLGVFARIDEMIAQIENHDAAVNSMVFDVRRAAANAKIQFGRVQRDGETLLQKIKAEREAVKKWRDRALGCSTQEEPRALECLRQAKLAESRALSFEKRLPEHEKVQKQLEKDIGNIHQRLRELHERQNILRTRESRARALQGLGDESQSIEELQAVFDRWETRVAELEQGWGCENTESALEEEFISKEEEIELRQELNDLKQNTLRI